jgi:LacI family transcriptional regulator
VERLTAKITDVAARAGVSSATASRALNGAPTVNPELADRVRTAADDLGYRRNGMARNLRRQRTDVWALVVSDIANPFFTVVARGVEDIAQQAGYSVLLCNADEDPDKEADYLDVAEHERVSGVIISPNGAGTDLRHLRAAHIPVVAVDRPLADPVDTVLVHSRRGACEATRHLLESGWTRPACISGPGHVDTSAQRVSGYLDALRETKRRPLKTLIRYADYHRAESARAEVAAVLGHRVPPDSFFVANSSMALGVLEELNREGLRPGQDVGLIAFDDAPWTALVDPPISVVAQPAYDIGVYAGRMLLRRIADQQADSSPHEVQLTAQLVIRRSSLRASEHRSEKESRE